MLGAAAGVIKEGCLAGGRGGGVVRNLPETLIKAQFTVAITPIGIERKRPGSH